jgi:drug/metabolite transporter (DMT)-like permease
MTRYIFMVLAGAVSFGILSSFVKLAYQQGYSPAEISFAQALTGAAILWILALFYRKNG